MVESEIKKMMFLLVLMVFDDDLPCYNPSFGHTEKLTFCSQRSRHQDDFGLYMLYVHTHRIHGNGTYIYLHEWLVPMVNVGTYTSPMDLLEY